ncbi:MAG: aminoacyl-tRNA deacylase [Nitrososphaerota archaeon]
MDLENYLKQNNVWYRFISKPETIHTADAARVTGIELKRVTKNLVCKTNEGEYVLLIIPGDKKVDLKKASEILKVKKVYLMPFDKAEEISGYPPGGTPSVGHKIKMKVIVDKSILNYETIYCGGGSRDKLLELRTSDIIRLNNAIIAEIAY